MKGFRFLNKGYYCYPILLRYWRPLYPTLNLVLLWHKRLIKHCQPNSIDLLHHAIICQRHLEWIERKIKLQPLHKLAIFLWPKLSQLPVLTAADRSRVHEDARAQISPKADDAEAGPWGDLSGEEPRATRRTPKALEWEDEKEKEDSAMENERHSRVVEGRRIVFA